MSGGETDLRALALAGPVHFMGAGGAGMCALAELLLRSGGEVSGCDLKDSVALRDLARLGARVFVGHDPAHVEEATALVMTSAVPADHPELARARARGIPVLKRAAALGAWVNRGKLVAVAGTHGKTTTTAMAAEILAFARREPTGLVGGRVPGWGGNLLMGSGELYVVEADEYDRSFLTLTPDVAVVTNVEADHLDVYGDLEGVRAAFRAFLSNVRPGGVVAACADDHGAASLLGSAGSSGTSYGLSAGSRLRAVHVVAGPQGTLCEVYEGGEYAGMMRLAVAGVHNLRNALGAASAARALGVSWEDVHGGLAAFRGVGRRFERLGSSRVVDVVDDYAHHPTEIRATLSAVRTAFPHARVVAAFQPHLYSRTRDFHAEFGASLSTADVVWVTDVFPAREAPLPGVTGALVADAARAAGADEVHYVPSLDDLSATLAADLREGDVLVTRGAGSVEQVGGEVLRRMGEAVHA
ncbi:MAG: UDP-N-acetylmuramate--L-alanine ligase [Gemmatimonadetes bacterium]|nr:UDP-N-acetylmuramate--L-alanine ligase [Gemmatimonadota bacterium]